MITKLFEIRDRATFIPAIAIKTEPAGEAERYLLGRAGYGTKVEHQAAHVLLARLVGNTQMLSDLDDWGGRTMPIAHEYIKAHFDELETGAVVDVQYILGERDRPKESEAVGEGPDPRD